MHSMAPKYCYTIFDFLEQFALINALDG